MISIWVAVAVYGQQLKCPDGMVSSRVDVHAYMQQLSLTDGIATGWLRLSTDV